MIELFRVLKILKTICFAHGVKRHYKKASSKRELGFKQTAYIMISNHIHSCRPNS